MPKVTLHVDIDPEHYEAYRSEARRRGVTVESLIEQTVEGMLGELQREELEGTDHPITPA
jgi:hypothetical protein